MGPVAWNREASDYTRRVRDPYRHTCLRPKTLAGDPNWCRMIVVEPVRLAGEVDENHPIDVVAPEFHIQGHTLELWSRPKSSGRSSNEAAPAVVAMCEEST